MTREIQIRNLRRFRDGWREYSKTCEMFSDLFEETGNVLKSLEGHPEVQEILARRWTQAYTKGFQKERRTWAEGVRRGGLFRNYHRQFEVCSPRTRFGTVFIFRDDTFFRAVPLRDIEFRPTLLNLVHCARCNWDDFKDEERQKTVEVLTGAVLTQMTRRPYRQWDDLAAQVLISLFEYPEPKFMSWRIACHNQEDKKIIYSDIRANLVLAGLFWWDGFKSHCLSQLDKDFRPTKSQIMSCSYDFSMELASRSGYNVPLDQADCSPEANIPEHFLTCQVALEALSQYGKRTQQALLLSSQGHTIEKIAKGLDVGSETIKTLLKRSRKKAKESSKMAALRQAVNDK